MKLISLIIFLLLGAIAFAAQNQGENQDHRVGLKPEHQFGHKPDKPEQHLGMNPKSLTLSQPCIKDADCGNADEY